MNTFVLDTKENLWIIGNVSITLLPEPERSEGKRGLSTVSFFGFFCPANPPRKTGLINIIWPHFFNGCDITRPTEEWLLQAGAGEWAEVDLKPGPGEGKYDTIPHVIGTLTKRK
jgi:hypothetical protein